jgi:hypothetical protein
MPRTYAATSFFIRGERERLLISRQTELAPDGLRRKPQALATLISRLFDDREESGITAQCERFQVVLVHRHQCRDGYIILHDDERFAPKSSDGLPQGIVGLCYFDVFHGSYTSSPAQSTCYQAVETFVGNPTRMKNRANAWERCSR